MFAHHTPDESSAALEITHIKRKEQVMNKTMTKLCFLSLMTVGFAAACSGDPADNNGTTTQDMNTSTDNDMNGGGGDDMKGGGMDADMGETPEPDMPGGMDMGDDMSGGGETAQSCSDPNPPARCNADPGTFTDWAPASVVSKLQLTATMDSEIEGETLEGCCYDFTGDGELNNALGGLVDSLGGTFDFDLAGINETLQGAIDDGSVALVLEHQGVDPANGGPFAINFLLGQQDGDFLAPDAAGGNQYKINPASFDQGVWPQARIGNATLAGTSVSGGPGVVALSFTLFGINLNLRIVAAQVEASVTSTEGGVKLENGKLGGVLRINDLVGAVNNFAATNCGCLMLDNAPLINGDNVADGYSCTGVTQSTCENGAGEFDSVCAQVSEQCGLVATALPALADVNSEAIGTECYDDETCDSLSVGFRFEAAGAVITGVGAAE